MQPLGLTKNAVVADRHGECNINTASDFIAQYTSRQEYKYIEDLPASVLNKGEVSPQGITSPNSGMWITPFSIS